jgi:putative restriction endonuclease
MFNKLENLAIGAQYERPFLAKAWGYKSHQAIARGVVTTPGSKEIILFVTKEKQKDFTQYNDYIDGPLLFWEGEEKHGSDKRIINAEALGESVGLFYRDIHHSPFTYYGKIRLTDFEVNINKPSEFIFRLETVHTTPDVLDDVENGALDFPDILSTEREALRKSRIGQGQFREELIKLWGNCSVTSLSKLSLLRASHIKPWRHCTDRERLDKHNGLLLPPNLDATFDAGMITFDAAGQILISKVLTAEERQILGIKSDMRLRKLHLETMKYLEYHRENIYDRLV